MAVTNDPRYGTARWSDSTDPWPGRGGWNTLLNLITTKAAIGLQGLSAARPAAGIVDRLFWATDTKRLYWDDGSAWTEISPVGGGGAGRGPTAFTATGADGIEGTARTAARSDHKHPQEPWPVGINNFNRGGDDLIGVGGFRGVISGGIGAGSAGNWLFGFTLILGTQSGAIDAFTTGNIRMTVAVAGGPPISLTDDMRADLNHQLQPYSWSRPYLLGAGDLNLQLYVQANNAIGQIRGNGSHMWAVYLGPA